MKRRIKKSDWKSSAFGWHGISGVYCVCTRDDDTRKLKVWYVGQSKNIGKRLNNRKHPYRVLYENGMDSFIRYYETDNPVLLEKRVVEILKPELNKNFVH